jgi:hypothetical protein
LEPVPDPILPPENDCEALIDRLMDVTTDRNTFAALLKLALTEVRDLRAQNARLKECQRLRKAA